LKKRHGIAGANRTEEGPAMNSITSNTATLASALRAGLAAGLLLGAALLVTPARADEMSLEGQIAQSRLVAQVTTALHGYSHNVDALAQSLSSNARGRTETSATLTYRRLVWLVSALQSSAGTAEVDEYAAVQQMVAVYNEVHEQIAQSGRVGDMTAAARGAQAASGIAQEIGGSLQRIASRGYSGMFQTAELRKDPVQVTSIGSKVATIQ
jgi:hypothetical protein